MQRTLHHTGDGKYLCSICNQPVQLETAKTNEDGHVVHAECYVGKLTEGGLTIEQRDRIRSLCAQIVNESDPKMVIALSLKLSLWLDDAFGNKKQNPQGAAARE